MKEIKKLAGETVIYGLTSIIGRFLNWLLTPLYTFVFLETADLGWVTNIYAYVALLLVMLTYGMETGFFRFASKKEDADYVFSTSLISLFSTSSVFIILIVLFSNSIANKLDMPEFGQLYVLIMGITVAIDAFSAIPFAKLRLDHRPVRFAIIKVVNITINISLNLVFFLFIPWLVNKQSIEISWYNSDFGIGYAFLSNLVASTMAFILLIPYMRIKLKFNTKIWRKMINYSFPILIVGITGMINLNIDKILLPLLLSDVSDPIGQLGIYGACFKLAVVMNMFIQAFRYAFEPFFFGRNKKKDSKEIYAVIMKYFTILSLFIFLGISVFIDLFKQLIAPAYWEGIMIIPIVMMGIFFMGVYYNLSLWYKLTDKTRYGAYMGIFGSFITLSLNYLLVPYIGFIGSAIALLTCFVVMCVISYVLGQKYFKVKYDLKRFVLYLFSAVVLFIGYWLLRTPDSTKFGVSILVIVLFALIVLAFERKEFKTLMKAG